MDSLGLCSPSGFESEVAFPPDPSAAAIAEVAGAGETWQNTG